MFVRQDTAPSPSKAHRYPLYIQPAMGRPALPVLDGEATDPIYIYSLDRTMEEEFQEAEILWPAGVSGNSQGEDGGGEAAPACSVRHRPRAATPVDISRQKRRCRPWPVSSSSEHYYATTLDDQETDDVGDGAKGTTANHGSAVVPPHVLVARRRRLVRGRTAAYSMCAGKGRTLKGRDLRDVRNLVLKMTGFIEE